MKWLRKRTTCDIMIVYKAVKAESCDLSITVGIDLDTVLASNTKRASKLVDEFDVSIVKLAKVQNAPEQVRSKQLEQLIDTHKKHVALTNEYLFLINNAS